MNRQLIPWYRYHCFIYVFLYLSACLSAYLFCLTVCTVLSESETVASRSAGAMSSMLGSGLSDSMQRWLWD